MYFLFVLGNQMEPQLGRVKFLLLYVASLLGGSAGVILIDQGAFTAGASGAVFGLLGAMAVGIWQHGINPFTTQIGTLLLINLGLTFFVVRHLDRRSPRWARRRLHLRIRDDGAGLQGVPGLVPVRDSGSGRRRSGRDRLHRSRAERPARRRATTPTAP